MHARSSRRMVAAHQVFTRCAGDGPAALRRAILCSSRMPFMTVVVSQPVLKSQLVFTMLQKNGKNAQNSTAVQQDALTCTLPHPASYRPALPKVLPTRAQRLFSGQSCAAGAFRPDRMQWHHRLAFLGGLLAALPVCLLAARRRCEPPGAASVLVERQTCGGIRSPSAHNLELQMPGWHACERRQPNWCAHYQMPDVRNLVPDMSQDHTHTHIT